MVDKPGMGAVQGRETPRLYHVDVIGHHRKQSLSYTDLENRLA